MSDFDAGYLGNLDNERKAQAEALKKENTEIMKCFRASFMDTPEARKVLLVLAGYTRLLATTFTGNSVSYLNEGKRDVMLYILEMCGVRDLKAVALIMKTATEAEEDLKHAGTNGSHD